MKIEDINDLTELETKSILVDLYNSFVSDAEYYKVSPYPDDLISDSLHKVFTGRVTRVNDKIARIRTKKN